MKKFPLVLSNKMISILTELDHDIARDLLSLHGNTDVLLNQSFISISNLDSDVITFIQPNKASQLLGITCEDDTKITESCDFSKILSISDKHSLYTECRAGMKWGRFLNTNFPNKYPISLTGGQNSKDIESFVNLYKAFYNRTEKFKNITVLVGNDIKHFYSKNNYHSGSCGSLGSSCMGGAPSNYFDIYSKNPDKVGLVVMFSNAQKTKIKARALLWTLDTPADRKFMDRIYTNDYADEQVMMDFARENGWFYKTEQAIGCNIAVVDPINKSKLQVDMSTELSHIEHSRYPYCDTMAYYCPNSGIIANNNKSGATHHIQDTGGSYSSIRPVEMIFSKYYNHEIRKEDAIYCSFSNDYVLHGDEVRVLNTGLEGRVYAVKTDENIAKSEVMIGEKKVCKTFPKYKCTWSTYLNTWLFTDSILEVWTDVNRTNKVLEHKERLNVEFFEINEEFWLKGVIESLKGDDNVKPINKPKGWQSKKVFIDDDGNIFMKGKFMFCVKKDKL